MHVWPDAAALLAGFVALLIRVSNSAGPRSKRSVAADTAGTLALGYAAFRLVLGVDSDNVDLAFGAAVICGAVGWETVKRYLSRWADKRVEK
jgi:hypothetical protein